MDQGLSVAWIHLQVVTMLVHLDFPFEEVRHLNVVSVVGHDFDLLATKKRAQIVS